MTEPNPLTTPTQVARRTCVLAFTPRTPKIGSHPTTPDIKMDSSDKTPMTLDLLSKGHQLVIRGCISSNLVKTPVALVKDTLTSICQDPCFEYFSKVPIMVILFSNCLSNASPACYVELRYNKGEAGPKPQIDLLEEIWAAIAKFKPEWEIP